MMDEYRIPCPNGCLDREPDARGPDKGKPYYCNVNGCDFESPGMAWCLTGALWSSEMRRMEGD